MDLNGEYLIPAPREKVWEALNDTQVLKACIPGCQELLRISDGELSAKVTVKVGAIKAPFGGRIILSDVDPPYAYTISGQGQGGAAGFARGSARISLDAHGVDTLLTYKARIDVGGKLVSVGSRLLEGVAVQNADEFFARFNRLAAGVEPSKSGMMALPEAMPGAAAAANAPQDAAPPVAMTGEPLAVVPVAPRPSASGGEELPTSDHARAAGNTPVIAAGMVIFLFILLLLYW